MEGKGSLKLDPMPGYLGDFRDEKDDEKDELEQSHKEMKELEYQSGHSELFYFLPSITDGSEEVNQHFNKIRVSPNT